MICWLECKITFYLLRSPIVIIITHKLHAYNKISLLQCLLGTSAGSGIPMKVQPVISDFTNSSSDIVTGCSKIILCSPPPSYECSKDLHTADTGNAVDIKFHYTEEILNYFHNVFRNSI
jgi:hypothetical protein